VAGIVFEKTWTPPNAPDDQLSEHVQVGGKVGVAQVEENNEHVRA